MAIRTIDEIFRDFNTPGVPSSGAFKPIKADIRDTLNSLIPVGAAQKIFIFSSGQSNMSNRPAYAWTPPVNLKIWDFWGQADASSVVGSGFLDPDNATIGCSIAFAAEVARSNPDKSVWLVDISAGGMPISNWGPTPPDYNFRQAIDGNLPPAIAAAGVSTVDIVLWWQGESDGSSNNFDYVDNFNTFFHDWLRGKSWFRYETPIIMFGLPENSTFEDNTPTEVYANFTSMILACVAYDPDTRMFVRPGMFPNATYWDSAAPIRYLHMTGAGYWRVGKLAYDTWAGNSGRGGVDGLVVNPKTGNLLFYGGGTYKPTYGPEVNEEFVFWKDQNSPTTVTVKNLDPGGSAQVAVLIKNTTGTLTQQIAGTACLYHWPGGSFAIQATNATTGTINFNAGGVLRHSLTATGGIIFYPAAAAQALSNGGLSVEFTSNTQLTFRARGTDGVTRTATLTLA